MIQVHTQVSVIDNSGIMFVRCIRLLRGSKKNRASIGNYVVASVQKVAATTLKKKNKLKKVLTKGDICKGIIVSINNYVSRLQILYVKSSINSIILVGDNFLPLASRIIGPVFIELRRIKQLKILTLANIII